MLILIRFENGVAWFGSCHRHLIAIYERLLLKLRKKMIFKLFLGYFSRFRLTAFNQGTLCCTWALRTWTCCTW